MRLAITLLTLLLATSTAEAQLGDWIAAHQKISDTRGLFGGTLADGDTFGIALASLGDIDSDGMIELAVGAQFDDGNGTDRGAIWILTLGSDGRVVSETKVGDATGGFDGALSNGDLFGHAIAALGDVDGDGVCDLAVNALFDDGGGSDRGAVWILFMNADETVKGSQKINANQGMFGGTLDDDDYFGIELEAPGDLDGDGVPDLLVGAYNDDDGGTDRGALWILYLMADGNVKAEAKISQSSGGFSGMLADGDQFGAGIACLGDLDGNGVGDVAVGAHSSDEAGSQSGSLWILFLDASETVIGEQKISAADGGFQGTLQSGDLFGLNLGVVGDLDGDGVNELGVSAILDDDGGQNKGAFWVLFLASDGTVRDEEKISSQSGGFDGVLKADDHFGRPELVGDLDGDGTHDLAAGATGTDDGGPDRGAIWILFANPCAAALSTERNGTGVNPSLLTASSLPKVGLTWDLTVDATGQDPGCIFLVGMDASAAGPVLPEGELLVDTTSNLLLLQTFLHAGAPIELSLSVPTEFSLCGLEAYLQALLVSPNEAILTNALDGVLGP